MTRKPPRKLKLVLFGILAGLCAFECALQVLAWMQWQARGRHTVRPAGDARDTVLCVGDSFTYGLGAEDPANSYPAAAEREYARRKPSHPLRFVNAGWPGSDSNAVLARLPKQLEGDRPRLVYVLVGYNDFWSERTVGDPDAFPIEFRTWRLITMAVAALRGGPADAKSGVSTVERSSVPFLGPWHEGSVWVAFRVDGRVETTTGDLPALWSADATHLWLDMRDGSARTQIDYRLDGDRLSLKGGMFAQGVVLQRGMPSGNALERGRAARLSGDLPKAESELREALTDPALAAAARFELAEILGESHRAEEGAKLLGEAQQAFDAHPLVSEGRRLLDAWLAVGRPAEATRVMERLLRELPIDDGFVQHMALVALRADDPASLDRAVQAALARPELTTRQRIGLLGLRPVLLHDDADVALDCLVRLASIAPDDDSSFVRTIVWDQKRFTREAFARALDRAQVVGASRDGLLARFDRAASSPDRTVEVLAANLRRIVQTCREAGAEPVLLDYPADRPAVAQAADEVANALGVGRLRLVEHFAELVRSTRREDWYVADGHCNDRGYVEMGRMVAEDVDERLAR